VFVHKFIPAPFGQNPKGATVETKSCIICEKTKVQNAKWLLFMDKIMTN
jgi:hypothetical protein